MSLLNTISFDYKKCIAEIDEFKALLEPKTNLNEQRDILPFFKARNHLSAFIASIFPEISTFDKLKHEFPIYQDFRCDLAIGDSTKNIFCFVEFEDANENSIFIQGQRSTPEWAPRFEKGYSQIIDWFWKLEDMQSTGDFRRKFGDDGRYYGLLVIGRSHHLDKEKTTRLKWRMKKVIVNSMPIFCLSFDELYITMRDKIEPYRLLP